MTKTEKYEQPRILAGITDSTDLWEGINAPISKESKDKVKSSEGSCMETDQAEQLDPLLNQSVNVLNKNHYTKVTDGSTISKQDNRPPPHILT